MVLLALFILCGACIQTMPCAVGDASCNLLGTLLLYQNAAAEGCESEDQTWVTFAGSTAGGDYSNRILPTADCGVLATGIASGTMNISGEVNGFNGGSGDILLIKYDAAGSVQWHTLLGSTGYDTGGKALQLPGGDYIVVSLASGTFGSPIIAYPGGTFAAAISRISSTGELVWNTFLGSATGQSYAIGVALDAAGKIYVGGHSQGSLVGAGTPVNASTTDDLFVARFDQDGQLEWHSFAGAAGDSETNWDLALLPNGPVILGQAPTSATFGSPILAPAGNEDPLVAHFDTSGNLVWHTYPGSAATDSPIQLKADGDTLLLTFEAKDNLQAGAGSAYVSHHGTTGVNEDCVILRLNSAGAVIEHTFVGGNGVDNQWCSIALSSYGDIALSADTSGTYGDPLNPYSGSTDIGIQVFHGSLDQVNYLTFQGDAGAQEPYDLKFTADGNLLIGGPSATGFGTPINGHSGVSTDSYVMRLRFYQ